MLRKSLIVLCIVIISVGFSDTVFSNSRIFLDIGVVGSISKTKESNKCYDLGLKAKMTEDIFLKSEEEAVLHKCSDLCNMDGQKLDNKGSYGARFGIYKQVDKFFAIGLDMFSEWYNVEYNDDSGYKFQCTGDSCQKQVRYNKFHIDAADGKLKDDRTATETCCNLFNSKRFSTCNPFFKKSKRQQIGGLVSLKLYTNSRASFVKFGVGIGQLKRRIPVAIPHEACPDNSCAHADCDNKVSAQHAFKIENVSAKKGLVFGVSLGTKVSQNMFFGVDFLAQQNKNKENTETYKNRKIGVSLSMELGR